jgi:ATP-binding cassette subfamily B protein
MLTFPVSAIGWTASMIQRAAASQKRLNEFLSIQPIITQNKQSHLQPANGDIQFKDVSFTYPHSGVNAISDFNLHIPAGTKLLVLGKTGSGKSTIAQLLTRMYQVDKGQITIDGNLINEMNIQSLRTAIGYVQQDVFLFSDSIENNIHFGLQDILQETDLIDAAHTAHVKHEIENLPQAFKTLVGERGTTLSGGQKQRVAIARALIKRPSIFIFDDCLSAVDAQTEQTILQSFKNYIEHKTTIMITHRIFFGFNFDLIIYLEDGKIAEMGTHELLLAKNGLYAELYHSQQSQASN